MGTNYPFAKVMHHFTTKYVFPKRLYMFLPSLDDKYCPGHLKIKQEKAFLCLSMYEVNFLAPLFNGAIQFA